MSLLQKELKMDSRKINTSRRTFLAASGALVAEGMAARWGKGSGMNERSELPSQRDSAEYRIIDCHAHVGISRQPGTTEELSAPWDTVADAEIILQHAEEAGIDKTIIFPINNINYKQANEHIARMCQRYPKRFAGFCRHDAETEERGTIRAMMFHEIRDLGLRGLKLHTQPSGEILDAARDLRIPVLYDSNQHAELFEEFLSYYPTVDFIAPHLGSDQSDDWREHLLTIDLAKRYRNFHIDTAAVVLTEYLEKAIRELPAEQILFGSDEPEIDCRLEMYKLRVLNLPKEKAELICGGNIERLLGGRI
jgi:uncharacterized protein